MLRSLLQLVASLLLVNMEMAHTGNTARHRAAEREVAVLQLGSMLNYAHTCKPNTLLCD